MNYRFVLKSYHDNKPKLTYLLFKTILKYYMPNAAH